MSADPVILVATVTPLPEHREEVRAAATAAVPAAHAEDGCVLFALHETDDAFVIVEIWRDEEALTAHSVGPQLTEFRAAVRGKLTGRIAVQRLSAMPLGEADKGVLRPVG
ncbi:MAG: antibiotic biosynthesis monooxygenase [Actinomycetota bacterium]|nr:MAG: antibiotic biosynthesis monooxygenase [Actinomycetota bacterium]